MTKMPKEKQQPPPSSLGQSLSTKSLAKSETIGTKQKEKQPLKSSLAPSLSTKPLAKSKTIDTKQKEKQPPPAPPPRPDSASAPSSNGKESPAPSYSSERLTGASTAVVLPKHHVPSSDSTDGEVEEEDESSESEHESKEEDSQMEKKQPPLLSPPSSNTNKKQEKQPPLSSLGPSLSTKPLAKSEKTGTKQKEKQPPPLLVSPPASSSNGEESPSPKYPLEKAIGASTTDVLPKHSEPSLDTTDGEVEEDNSSESDHESMEEESSDDSAAVEAKPNPPVQLQASREGKGQQTSRSTSCSGSEDGEDDEEDDEEEVGSSSESDQPVPTHKQAENIVMKSQVPIAENVSDSSSDSEQAISPHRSSIRTAVPLSSKPMDCPALYSDNIGIIANPSSSISGFKKKRKRANEIREEAGQEKKSPIKRIWTAEDELGLLRGVLDYKERHHVVPSNLVQLEPLYDSIKGLISIPVTSHQMFEKVGRIRRNYIKRAKKLKESLWTRSLNGHSAAVFNISAEIWGEKIWGDITNLKEEQKHVGEKGKHERYPYLHRFIKYEHTCSPWALQLSHISNAKSNSLEKKCEKLEITEVRLHVKKQVLFSAAMELIDGALPKCE